ncbi:hypothetical protein ABDK00_018370 [Niabella insulamsoli]|uniref:hypothetical protein n=1 Tax=Niabella insulamsoli TaxID=3144874 RepID=UPI0031FC3765
MKMLTFSVALLLCLFAAQAQTKTIELSSETRPDRSVDISYRKTDPGYYTVVLNFSDYTNTSKPLAMHSISGVSGRLISLKPTDKDKSIGYSYRYTYIRGKLEPRVHKDFCYVLPYNNGVKCTVVEAGFAPQRYFGAEKPADWKSYFFYTTQQQPVNAIRKGVVVETADTFDDPVDVEFTTRKNRVIIEHEDGTLAIYRGFEKGSVAVKVGDAVFPGTLLGSNIRSSKKLFGISIHIYYLASIDFDGQKKQTLSTQTSLYRSVSPKFTTAGKQCAALENMSEHTALLNEELITKEMSKKELKKYKATASK